MNKYKEIEIIEAACTAFNWGCSVLERCENYKDKYWRALVFSELGRIAVDRGEKELGGDYEVHKMPVRIGSAEVLVSGVATYWADTGPDGMVNFRLFELKDCEHPDDYMFQGFTPEDYKMIKTLVLRELTNNYELRKELNNA